MRPRSSMENLPLQTSVSDPDQYLEDTSLLGLSIDYQTKDETIFKQKYLIAAVVFGVIGIISLISMFFFL